MNNVKECQVGEFLVLVAEGILPFFVDKQEMPVRSNALDQVSGILEIMVALLLLCKGYLCLPHLDGPANHMHEFHVECFGIPPFLEVEISAVIQGFDNDLFAPPPGEDDKRDIPVGCANLFKKGDTVHPRHLVIGYDCIVMVLSEDVQANLR